MSIKRGECGMGMRVGMAPSSASLYFIWSSNIYRVGQGGGGGAVLHVPNPIAGHTDSGIWC